MASNITIVMYHYVRNLADSRYPAIKALQTDQFLGQLDYLGQYYEFISMHDCVDAFIEGKRLPKNSCLLTFDDGFIDHYVTVFPILRKMGIPAAFFPPAKPILENTVLDVHKIQFVLAKTHDDNKLIKDFFHLLSYFRPYVSLPDDDALYSTFSRLHTRFDTPEVIFIKSMLQSGLPINIRHAICSELFKRMVSEDERAFSRELYVSLDQLNLMVNAGMYVGGHGYSHEWMQNCSEETQRDEVQRTVQFLGQIHERTPSNWVMCYPSGSYDATTVRVLKEYDCALGLSVEPDVAQVDPQRRFSLPRLDTSDFPFARNGEIAKWTRSIMGE